MILYIASNVILSEEEEEEEEEARASWRTCHLCNQSRGPQDHGMLDTLEWTWTDIGPW